MQVYLYYYVMFFFCVDKLFIITFLSFICIDLINTDVYINKQFLANFQVLRSRELFFSKDLLFTF